VATDDVPNTDPKPASAATQAVNQAVAAALPFHDRTDFERAGRGLLARPPGQTIANRVGWPVWDFDAFAFLDDDCPASANPSLWRQAQLNRFAGLFEVADGFYQVRGYDLSNVSFIAGDTGWIVIDPLTATETAKAARELVDGHFGAKPIHAVIYTHSHVDHFAGVKGLVDEADARAGAVRVIAPDGFLEAAISENVIAGNAMTRRASYMYGALLPKGPLGHLDAGLGKGVPLMGSPSLIAPTETITETGTELTIDGVRIVFQLTPGTEAPAEMNFHFPDRRILCMAENCTANQHNLYTLRGAQVRDALGWSRYINESIELFANDTDVLFASHHWPRWGADDARQYLANQRDAYRYVHDQTMRLANHGYSMLEVAEQLELPPALAGEFYNRDYYGTVNHNAKAVYQRYLGWFDANPAHLHPLPPEEAAVKYVEFMGGADAVLEKARAAFDAGEYRWVAEVVNHVVFAEPTNARARALQADALEQLGYQAESGPWRGFYLTGAQELRNGTLKGSGVGGGGLGSSDITSAMTVGMLLDYLGVRLDGPAAAAAGLDVEIGLVVTDREEQWVLGVSNGALRSVEGRLPEAPAATLTLDYPALLQLAEGTPVAEAHCQVEGDVGKVELLFGLLDTFELWFDIVTP
jgi:alkyl sulfatase BDS1-like metallo-beta-lactamase superfamily hydrolase